MKMKMKMKITMFYIVILFFAFLTSCTTPKDIVYFQDVGNYEYYRNVEKYEVYIHQDDNLAILVNSKNTNVTIPFNLPMTNYYVGGDTYGQQRLTGYLVDTEGNIEFPVLGKLHVEGLTRNQLRDLIKQKLIDEDLIRDPIVTINFLNFKISVQGEVSRPGSFNITGERITLLEALSMAGDLTIYGKRDRVAVIRETKSGRSILYHNLLSTEIFSSPCYYLQQNDIVYVEPNKRRVQQSNINQNNSVSVWLSVFSVILTATSIIINVSK